MKFLFIDESGDHNLLPDKIDPQFPIFVLTGIVFDNKEYKKFQKSLLKFKKKILGTEKIILHAKEINRPSITKQKQIGELTNKEKRARFYLHLNKLIVKFDFAIPVFVIDKKWFGKEFGVSPPDPYFLGFSYLISQFEGLLNEKEHGKIYVERRNKILDKQFLLAWETAKATRVGLVTRDQLNIHKIEKPEICKKSWDQSGLELADLISYRLSRYFMNKNPKPLGNELTLEVINLKRLLIGSLPGIKRKN